MQISSRTEDFLIDTLILRDELSILNNVFTNPKVLKVNLKSMNSIWILVYFEL